MGASLLAPSHVPLRAFQLACISSSTCRITDSLICLLISSSWGVIFIYQKIAILFKKHKKIMFIVISFRVNLNQNLSRVKQPSEGFLFSPKTSTNKFSYLSGKYGKQLLPCFTCSLRSQDTAKTNSKMNSKHILRYIF